MNAAAPVGEFSFTRLEKVVFGPGRIAVLGQELARREVRRAVVVTGRTLGGSPLLDLVTGAMAGRCAGVFSGAAQHVPSRTVRDLTELLRRVDADAVVSFGGGSPIDTAKVAAASMLNGRDMTRVGDGQLELSAAFGPATGGPGFPHIAVPTTLSAGEYTPAGGATDEATRTKRATIDPRLQPVVVINDPQLTAATPDWLWAATGMRAMDHAIEAAYSIRAQPFVDALATKAIRLLATHLPPSLRAEGQAREAHRGQCQIAAWCSLYGGFNTGLGISHALGHQIGPAWDVPHGVTSCITLPHAMRFMAGAAPERFGPIADGLDIVFDPAAPAFAAFACADRITAFVAGLDVPRSLREVGVSHNQLPEIAGKVHEEIELFGTVGRPMRLEEVRSLLEAAYQAPD